MKENELLLYSLEYFDKLLIYIDMNYKPTIIQNINILLSELQQKGMY